MPISPGHQPSIALVSMPWAIFSRPSIQLGILKAFVENRTGCKVTTLHPYLQIAEAIGTDIYAVIADSSWAGESLFSALLFPDQKDNAQKNFLGCLGAKARNLPDFDTLLTTIEKTCNNWLAGIDWQSCALAGFSLCFNQLLASLYIAKQLKSLPGRLSVVFGGSSCSGDLGSSLLKNYPQIDYVIDGEGEIPLAGLCRYLSGETTLFPARVLTRNTPKTTNTSPEIADLNSLPTPDYTPYFQQMKEVFPDSPFIPVLPIEFSRGCWWNKCTFCNLNLQWRVYRWKHAATMVNELNSLMAIHHCLDFTFTDNTLPPREADSFFASTANAAADVRFFAEVRHIMHAQTLTNYRNGGLETIQVGIEALSETLLEKMKKGVSVIENIAMLKYALQAGIRLEGNLILEFPGSTHAEVNETLENIDYILPFKPLSVATFFLGHGSPVERNPGAYGIKAITQHHRNRRLFPHLQGLTLLIKEYRGDRQQQRKLWQPVRDKVSIWQDFHKRRTSQFTSPLSYREGGSFLIIRQEHPTASTQHHRLQGLSRAIYLFCNEIRTVSEIITQFNSLKESAILAFIHQLCQKRLMYRERDRILSLAIHQE